MARDGESRSFRRKFCKLCFDKVERIDYKDDRRLTRFITDRGKPSHVLLSIDEYQRLTERIPRIADLLWLPGAECAPLEIPASRDIATGADLE